MTTCPNCAAPLSLEGVCTSCGAVARGFYRELDLGRLDLAQAVDQGLDYYLLLQLTPAASPGEIQAAYSSRRLLFPGDTSRLEQSQRRHFELVEQAWYVLGDPARRQRYDELRTHARARVSPLPDTATRGIASFRAGQYDGAARLLRLAAHSSPQSSAIQIWYALSLLYGAATLAAPEDWRVREIEEALARAVAVDDSPRARAHLALGQAIGAYDRAVAAHKPPQQAELLAQAEAQLAQAETLLPLWHLPALVRAHWSLHQRRLGTALAWAERARRLEPADPLVTAFQAILRRNWETAPGALPAAAAQAARLLNDGTMPATITAAWR